MKFLTGTRKILVIRSNLVTVLFVVVVVVVRELLLDLVNIIRSKPKKLYSGSNLKSISKGDFHKGSSSISGWWPSLKHHYLVPHPHPGLSPPLKTIPKVCTITTRTVWNLLPSQSVMKCLTRLKGKMVHNTCKLKHTYCSFVWNKAFIILINFIFE